MLGGMFWLVGESLEAQARTLSQTKVRSGLANLDLKVPSNSDPNEDCLMCHSDPDFKGSFENGDLISLYVDESEYEHSVHDPAGLNCVACHTDISRYPHHAEEQVTCLDCHSELGGGGDDDTAYKTLRVELPFADYREMALSINESCRSCHEEEFEVAGDSVHVRVFERGNREAPVCVDCHGGHDITPPGEPRSQISHICGTCHRAVYSTYRSSVHGKALEESKSNPDVPVCTDCHGTHSIPSPFTAVFRTNSPEMCAGCHTNEELMDKYGLSAEVFKTYVSDFHGTTLQLSEAKSGMSPRQAVCYDCHGIHDIRRVDDPKTGIGIKENLLDICRQCHPEATTNFPDAWLGHYEPSPTEAASVYYIEYFFTILTASVIVGLILHMTLDFVRILFKNNSS